MRDTVIFAEKARHALSKQITQKFTQGCDALPVISLSATIESVINNSIQRTSIGSYLALDPDITQDILSAIRTTIHEHHHQANEPVILAAWEIRRYVRKLVELEFPWLQVLSRQDLEASCPLQVITVVQLTSNQEAMLNLTSSESASAQGDTNK